MFNNKNFLPTNCLIFLYEFFIASKEYILQTMVSSTLRIFFNLQGEGIVVDTL